MKEIEGMKIIPNPATLTNELLRVAGLQGGLSFTHRCVQLFHHHFVTVMSHALHNYHLKINALIIILITT